MNTAILVLTTFVACPIRDSLSAKPTIVDGSFTSFLFLADDHILTATMEGGVDLWAFGKDGRVVRKERKLSLQGRLSCLMGISKTKEHVVVKNARLLYCINIEDKTARALAAIPSDVVSGVVVTGESMVLLGCRDGVIRGYRLDDGKQIANLRPTFVSDDPVPVHLAISGDGKHLAAAYDRVTAKRDFQIHVWNLPRSKALCAFSGDMPLTAVFHPLHPTHLVFPQREKRLVVRRVSDSSVVNEEYATDKRISGLAFSADGRMLAMALADGSIHLEARGKRSCVFQQEDAKLSPIYQIGFSPSGNRLGARLLGANNCLILIEP